MRYGKPGRTKVTSVPGTSLMNELETYAIIIKSTQEIIEKFRNKDTAMIWLPKITKDYWYVELEVVELPL